MANGITSKLPLTLGEEGDFELIRTYEDLVKQNLTNLLLTNQGERPMDSEFGVGIRKFLFEPNVEFYYGEIDTKIRQQVERYMPFIEIEDIKINSAGDDAIQIQIYYIITPLDVGDVLTISQNNLPGL